MIDTPLFNHRPEDFVIWRLKYIGSLSRCVQQHDISEQAITMIGQRYLDRGTVCFSRQFTPLQFSWQGFLASRPNYVVSRRVMAPKQILFHLLCIEYAIFGNHWAIFHLPHFLRFLGVLFLLHPLSSFLPRLSFLAWQFFSSLTSSFSRG